ncbi:type II secretion system secretin GspD [Noviherbaspirillum saxi]|uniref:Type II secretion system protein GspD n=1 Tax=Noviherbaspirillum saxi TaxID=2320863 RepID=A0A3A3FTQ5_9BURK|nr:type II secretion system secretin GspD [Noviherbaspirillum saxi]RJF97571.1 type II secretion system protein GspD [Noviherbaspirillum saxi]
MKKNRSAETLQGTARMRRIGAAALLMCAMAGIPNVNAQDPSSNQATLNFVGADIESVIKAIGHYTRTTFIIDPRVKGTINLVSEKPVSKPQALQMLASSLRLQGFAMVKSDGVTKVVPEADAKLQAGPIQAGEVRGDQIATQIFRLNYESAPNLVQVLRPLISPNNTINVNPGNNSIVITDYADNLKRLGRIIAALDSPAVGDLDVVPIRFAVATDIAVLANRLLEQSGPVAGGDAGRVSVLADNRTNSVIIRAPSAARANLAKSLIAKLDQQTAQPGNVHVVYLRNADAVRLAQTLRAVVASDPSAQGGAAQQPPQQQQAQAVSPGQQAQLGQGALSQSQPTPTALPTGGAGGFIQADPATNALIITASEAVYRNLRTVIDQLDARRAQIYVESLIVEVSADRAAEFGIQWAGLSGDVTSSYRIGGATGFTTQGGGNNLISQAVSKATNNTLLPPGNGLNLGIFRQINGSLTLGALARALESEGNANILSMPNLITLDNEEARIIVGQNVPFVTGQFTTAASGGGAGINPFQTIERKDVGLSLRVRPQVSEGGTVKMAIYQETSNIQPTSNASDIITNKRSIETNVLVDDGQIIVLGGLIEDRVTDGNEQVPVLGDIPIVGNLFKYRSRTGKKTNLMVFLKPTVLRSNEQSVSVTGDRYEYIRNVQGNSQSTDSLLLRQVTTPVLPPLKDGRPVGGSVVNVDPRDPVPQSPPAGTVANPPPLAPGPAPVPPPAPAPDMAPPRSTNPNAQ